VRTAVSTPPWWASSPAVDLESTKAGLSSAEARRRLAESGPNRVEPAAARSLPRELLLRLRNPLVLLLLAAGALSAAAGAGTDAGLILAMVGLSVGLDVFQEHRASKAVERLRETVALRCTVLRDGVAGEVDVATVVPGDVVLLVPGERVPADGRLLEADHLFVNQGLLTGESFPAAKQAEPPPEPVTELQQARHVLFMGTSVVGGSARLQVVATGRATVLAEIAQTSTRQGPASAFEVSTHRFGLLVLRLTLGLLLFVLLAGAAWQRPMLESLLFAVALAVGLTPELLPMVVSVTLSRGAVRLARQRVIVKRLSAIHDLGAMDVLCTDKTGTLTEARIRLDRCIDAEGVDSARVLRLAQLGSLLGTGLRSPLDDAVLEHAGRDATGWLKRAELPFDFQRRRAAVLLEQAAGSEDLALAPPAAVPGEGPGAEGHSRWLIVKGAPEELIALCDRVERAGAETPLDEPGRQRLRERCQALEEQGCRTLAVAWRRLPASHAGVDPSDEAGLVFAGFASFTDPPKSDVASALAELVASGVALKVITGDSERVTRHLCGQIGIPVRGVLTGADIARLDEPALRARVARANLFCRVDPMQKSRIILALRARGHVVGYLGDGINDAPPLHAADVGLTVDSAVDVAREVADLVMLDRDLHVLHRAVLEGRRTVGNILKYMMMATSSNLGNMLSMAGAALVLPFLPLLPIQVLLNNLIYDLSELAIPLDEVDPEDLRRPRQLDMALLGRFMAVFGLISSLFDALTFAALLWLLNAGEALFRTGWFIESLLTQVLVIFVIRTRRAPWRSHPSRVLVASSLAAVALALALPWTPIGALFQFVPPPPAFLALLAVLVPAYLALAEAGKRLFHRRFEHRLLARHGARRASA
jgi:Mg2+-importing ATPase